MKIKEHRQETTTLKLSIKEFSSKFDIKDEIVSVGKVQLYSSDGDSFESIDPYIEIVYRKEELTEREI